MDNIIVKVATLGGLVKEVLIAPNSTLDQALAAAGVDGSNQEVKVNGRTPCGTLFNNDIVTLAPKAKGGNL